MVKPHLHKNTNISWAWWHVPLILATREAEAGELFEPQRQRLQWSEITPLHCSLVTERLCLKNKTKLNKKNRCQTVMKSPAPNGAQGILAENAVGLEYLESIYAGWKIQNYFSRRKYAHDQVVSYAIFWLTSSIRPQLVRNSTEWSLESMTTEVWFTMTVKNDSHLIFQRPQR